MKALLALTLCISTGCAALGRVDPQIGVPYAPLALGTAAGAPAYLGATRRALRELGFRVEHTGLHELEATHPTGDDTRDRAWVSVADGSVQIDVRTELRGPDGTWLRAEQVCASYRHVRERALAAAITRKLREQVASRE